MEGGPFFGHETMNEDQTPAVTQSLKLIVLRDIWPIPAPATGTTPRHLL
jgi:hypothetical protein